MEVSAKALIPIDMIRCILTKLKIKALIRSQCAYKTNMEVHIPIEIIRQILLKLKVKALIRCECVCKEWRSTIQDPDFKLSYRGRRRVLEMAYGGSSLNVTSLSNTLSSKTLFCAGDNPSFFYRWTGVWCSCNGLVLFSVGQHILLWNPSTRCCTKVLELQRLKGLWYHNVVSGLCYVPSTGDYKVVLLLRPNLDGTDVLVASLKNKAWRKVLFPYHAMSVSDGVNFNNTLHWRVSDFREKVVYFEAESDEFKELPTPTFPPGESCAILGLGIIDGGLSMACERRKGEVQILVMKEYGVKESWVSQFVISASQFISNYHTFYSSKDNTKVLIWSRLYGWGGTLVYDLKNNELENCFEEKGHHAVAICSYVESLVSPYEFIWKDNDQHKPPEIDNGLNFILERFKEYNNLGQAGIMTTVTKMFQILF